MRLTPNMSLVLGAAEGKHRNLDLCDGPGLAVVTGLHVTSHALALGESLKATSVLGLP